MKKLYFALFILLFSLGTTKAQMIITWHPTTDYDGPANTTLEGSFDVINSSNLSFEVMCESFNRNLQPSHYTYFCWKVCYDTSVTISPATDWVTMHPNDTIHTFHSYVVPQNVPGHDDISYKFYDRNGTSDSLIVTLNYDFTPVGIIELTTRNSFNITGANPASNISSVSYSVNAKMDARLLVTNMLGSKVREIKLNDKENTLTFSVKDLKQGVYVYSLVVDGKILSSKRLVVTH